MTAAPKDVVHHSTKLKIKPWSLFDDLVRLERDYRFFEHAYGPTCPPGKGWWSPYDEGPYHYVRARPRRRR